MPIALDRPKICEPQNLNQTSCTLLGFKRPLDDAVATLYEYHLGDRSFEEISGLHLSLRPNSNTYKISGRAPEDYEKTVLYADVYCAEGECTGENVALKIVLLFRNDTKEQYLHEVAALFQSSKIKAPPGGALPNFIDAGESWIEDIGIAIIAMKFMPGVIFETHIKESLNCDENQLIEIILTYAQHLAILERNGIIHQDPNQSNLIIEVNKTGNGISCATIDLADSALPKISMKQTNSRHKWARNSEYGLKRGLDGFVKALEVALEDSTWKLDTNFRDFLVNIRDRAAGTTYPNFRSFGELAATLEVAKEHVNKGNFHELCNI